MTSSKTSLSGGQRVCLCPARSRTVPVEVGLAVWGKRTREGRQQRLMRVADFLDEEVLRWKQRSLAEAAPLAVTPVVPVTAAHASGYLAQHQLFLQAPELLEGVGRRVLQLAGDADVDATRRHARAWLGPEGTITPLHYDHHENVLCQLIGAKLVILCEPPPPEPHELARDALGGTPCMCMYPCDGLPNASQVDAEAPDLVAFPQFAAVSRRACVLRPGEALYIPKGVWHYARSLSASLSVSMWFQQRGEV